MPIQIPQISGWALPPASAPNPASAFDPTAYLDKQKKEWEIRSLAMDSAMFADRQKNLQMENKLKDMSLKEAEHKYSLEREMMRGNEAFLTSQAPTAGQGKNVLVPTPPAYQDAMRNALGPTIGPAYSPSVMGTQPGKNQYMTSAGPVSEEVAKANPNYWAPKIQEYALTNTKEQKERQKTFETEIGSIAKSGTASNMKSFADFYANDSNPEISAMAQKLQKVSFKGKGNMSYTGYFDQKTLDLFFENTNETNRGLIPKVPGFHSIILDEKGNAKVSAHNTTTDELLQLKETGTPEEKKIATAILAGKTEQKTAEAPSTLVGFTEKGGLAVHNKGDKTYVINSKGQQEDVTDGGKYGKIMPKTTTAIQMSAGKSVEDLMGGKENADYHYQNYVLKGILPPMGFGSTKQRFEFLGNAAKWARVNNIDPQKSMAIQAEVKALDNSIKVLKSQQSMVDVAIKQTDKNAEEVNRTSSNFLRSNYPGPNAILTFVGKNIGNQKLQAEIGEFKVALMAFQREYMRVVTGGARSVAELSVGAQMTSEQILGQFDSWPTLKAKVAQARREIANTKTSYIEELSSLQNSYKNLRGEEYKEESATKTTGKIGADKYTPENIAFTAKERGISVEEVKRRLGIK